MSTPGSGMVVVVVVVGGTVVVVVVVGGRVVVVVVVVVGGGRVVVVVVVLDVVVVVGGTVVVVVVSGEIEVGGLVGRSVVEGVDGGAATTRSGVAAFDGPVGVVEGVEARCAVVVVPAGEAPTGSPVAVSELEDTGIVAGAIGGEFAVEMASPCDDAIPSAESGIAHVRPTNRPTTEISTTMARNASALSRSG